MNQTVNTPIFYGIIRKKDALNRIYLYIINSISHKKNKINCYKYDYTTNCTIRILNVLIILKQKIIINKF